MKIRGRPLAYEQAETGIAHVVMENLALEPTPPEDCTLWGNYAPTDFFEQLRLRLTFYERCDTLRITVSDAPFRRAQYPCNTSVEKTQLDMAP